MPWTETGPECAAYARDRAARATQRYPSSRRPRRAEKNQVKKLEPDRGLAEQRTPREAPAPASSSKNTSHPCISSHKSLQPPKAVNGNTAGYMSMLEGIGAPSRATSGDMLLCPPKSSTVMLVLVGSVGEPPPAAAIEAEFFSETPAILLLTSSSSRSFFSSSARSAGDTY